MTDCSRIQAMIEPFLGKELSSAQRDDFLTHVRNCRTCREELEMYYVVYSVVSQLDSDTDDGLTDYKAELQRTIDRHDGDVRARKVFLSTLEIIMAIAIVVCIVLLIYRGI